MLAGWLMPERCRTLTVFLESACVDDYYRKISKAVSFFSLKDSQGTTQLVARRVGELGASIAGLSDVQVESTVLVEGTVKVRPRDAQKEVS